MKFLNKLRALFRKGKLDAEMAEEMRQHVEMQVELNRKAGMKPEEARYAALRQFGNVARTQEHCREQRGWLWLEQAWQDVGYAGRQIAKEPGFAATVIVTLALGIGACTVVFTAINSTLLHPLAGKAVDREVIIHETRLPQTPQMQPSPGMFRDLQEQAKSFELVTGWTGNSLTIQGDTEPVQVRGAAISEGLMREWSPTPALGRNFTAEEFAKGERVMMLSPKLWQQQFGGSPAVIDRVVRTDNGDYRITGIIPGQFARYGSDLEFWVPLRFSPEQLAQRGAHYVQVGARLKPGVSQAQAQAELDVIAANTAREHPETNAGVGLLVRDIGAYINRSLGPMLKILLGAVACVLLIACANVANLLLARGTVRQREISIRTALGAGRGRIVRQLLMESLLLSALGGASGLLLAQWGLRFIRIYGPAAGTDMARLAYIELDPAVVAFTAGFSLLTGIVFGLAPAWLGSRANLGEMLKQGARGSTEGGARGRLRRTLLVFEVALALLLLAGAGLLLKSFARLTRIDPGFTPSQVVNLQVRLRFGKYANVEHRKVFSRALLEGIGSVPGVESVGLTILTPVHAAGTWPFTIAGQTPTTTRPQAVPYVVTPGYFRVMGPRLIRGRLIDERDGVAGPPVFLVNETLARQHFPDSDPIGQRIILNLEKTPGPEGEIVGVVTDVMQGMPGAPSPPQFYFPWEAMPLNGFNLVVRTRVDPATVIPLLKARVHALDPEQPVTDVKLLETMLDDKLARQHFMLVLLCIYGGIALAIAAVGIYAVMAYSVSQRTTEFGIRMALGASRGDVLRQVLRQGMLVVGAGMAIGLGATLALGQVVQSMLHNVSPRDPLTLALISALLLLVSLVACLLPARRATKVDPVVALRAE